jgi:NAD(P)-dependent dehydrogenase (short-subunit alcohol dehydrogenase family)
VNLRGTWLCTKYAAPFLLESTRGPSIVNASSIGGLVGIAKDIIYGPTKAAINHLTRQTAIDLAPRVRCNCYCPASTDTPMIDKVEAGTGAALNQDKAERRKAYLAPHLIPRVAEPEEVAKLVCYLASDDAAFITGAVFVIDGGVTAWRGTRQHDL